jgi:6,7-dimethyl-8-ribityllumazine synthase
MAKKMVASRKFDAIICLGAVIKGSTPHFDYVAAEGSKGVAQVGLGLYSCYLWSAYNRYY